MLRQLISITYLYYSIIINHYYVIMLRFSTSHTILHRRQQLLFMGFSLNYFHCPTNLRIFQRKKIRSIRCSQEHIKFPTKRVVQCFQNRFLLKIKIEMLCFYELFVVVTFLQTPKSSVTRFFPRDPLERIMADRS